MRLLSILTALVVAASLYMVVFERDRLLALATSGAAPQTDEPGTTESAAADPATPAATRSDERRVSVVALRSAAQEIDSDVRVRGRTEAARQVEVRAETNAQVTSEPLRKGAYVEQGDVLCQLDPGTREAELTEARARLPEAESRLAQARAQLAEAEINRRAADRLSEDGFASETRVASAVAAVETARAAVSTAEAGLSAAEAMVARAENEIDNLTIRAPFAGLLETDTAETGALLQAGALCATVIQLDPIKLVAFVPETAVNRVEVGAPATGRLATGQEVSGRVTFLSRSADETTRTFRVEVQVDNESLSIRDGQTVELVIQSDGTMAHRLPQSALTLDDEGRLGVRTVGDEGRAQFTPVSVLRDTTEGVWLAGLPDAAEVIVVGQDFVTDGVPLEVTYRETGG